ncbi:hypothetical protein H8356DRAFT_1346163 [Neocallimastix lanati (nom. inval.)]|nr:hypothetical protein H8356DRAFT_1346163 [Neocallimastix sp. JGI-2020a]
MNDAPVIVPSHQRAIFFISLAAKISENLKSDNIIDSFNDIYIKPINNDNIGENYIELNPVNDTNDSYFNVVKRNTSFKDILKKC